ncbi:MAG: hypothetical protein WCZ47_00225 [Bacilli bacterium]|jgi:predicted bacteriocin transport accessory protein|nr:hypothetical protein [Bacilli bacterium]
MRFQKILTLLILPLILGSCDNKEPFISIMQNPHVDVSSSEFLDYVRHTNSEEILYLIENNEPFIFYLGSNSCYGCSLFKPNLISYIQETKALVYYLNVDIPSDYEAYADIWYEYQTMFKLPLEVPYLLFIKNQTTFKKGSVSKMTSEKYETFEKMMNQLVKVTPNRLYSSYEKVETKFVNASKSLFIFYERKDEKSRQIFQNYLLPFLLKQQKEVEIVDLLNFSSEDKTNLYNLFSIIEAPSLTGYICENQVVVHKHEFVESNLENDSFLNLYFEN